MRKRWLKYMMAAMLIAAFAVPSAFAGGDSISAGGTSSSASSASSSGGTASAPSQPKLMVMQYYLDTDSLSAGSTGTLSVSVYNTNTTRAVYNLKMSFATDDNEIVPVNTGTKYLQRIKAKGWYEWKFDIVALAKATSGVHPATITMEYEDADGTPYTATDTLILEVRQPVKLSYDEPALDTRMTQGDTPTFTMQLMNMGKSTIYNALLTFALPGIANGGSVLVGTIEPGETKTGTTNFRVGTDTLGEVEGSVTLTYEDDFGQQYTKTLPLTTTVEEKVVAEAPVQSTEETKLNKKQIAVIAAVGGVIAIALIIILIRVIKKRREREEDERRL